ncbi:WD repeat protein [Talaromyces proteolyticus]|uniref:WD repeat protein n=1 Tax=Talaromyces proteolyticus TaxID=1131652 RepID=A0AAD4KR38_9EURO|nr:WD repeat protein [Talaromyces proteolyticus]KAH8698569.1 WD repeat protein [Talaromyces proteolyticus]
MRAVLPGRPQTKLQALSTALWDGIRIVAYISGHALVILTGAQTLLQTIYVDDTDCLEAISIDEATGQIAVSGGSDIFIYRPNGFKGESLKWSLAFAFCSEDDDEDVNTLSWGTSNELLVANSILSVWFLNDNPRLVWKKKLAGLAKFAEFSPDAEFVATTGKYDQLVKIWKRLSFGADDVRFEVSYLPHLATVTKIHWRKPFHREQSIENVLYTMCADGKIRIWAVSDHQALSVMHLWTEIDMNASIQPRDSLHTSNRRYGFIVDGRDFRAATERAVQRNTQQDNLALEHLVEVANKSPDVCIIIDDYGHMCAWAVDNIGGKAKSAADIFNILHIEGLQFSLPKNASPQEDYAQFYSFGTSTEEESLSILAHYFDGRIEWIDSKVDVLFDPTPRKNRLTSRGIWSGHTEPIKKIVRNAKGHVLVSRTDDNNAMIWRQKVRGSGSILTRQSSLSSQEHIHRTCVIGDGHFLINLHHNSLSLWDIQSSPAVMLDSRGFSISSKPLCALTVPNPDSSDSMVYIATISADMKGIAWEVDLLGANNDKTVTTSESATVLRQFCTFDMGLDEDVAYVLAVDPAGQTVRSSGSLDLFAADIALSYTTKGTIHSWAAKVDKTNQKLDWLLTSTVETGVANPSLASGSSIRKAALVDQERTHLTIWDTSGAQLEFEEQFPDHDMIRDLDWTSTPDQQSILAVGFSHKVILLSQLRYDYLDAGPSWTPVREIRIRDLTPHPIGDSCWLGSGNLVVGTGNQLFVYDKGVEAHSRLVSKLRIQARRSTFVDLFDVVSRLNGPLPVYHPQFLAQCILSGKTSLVHLILLGLNKKLKFYTEGDEIDTFLEIPIEEFYRDNDDLQRTSWKGLRSSTDLDDHEPQVLNENVAAILNENLTRVTLPQLSSHEQFRLVDLIECVATVEKHRRSMDANAARYLLFFRHHMLRRSQGVANKDTVSWREIVWALHSDSQDIIADLVSRQFSGKMLWKSARESGIFMWLSDPTAFRAQLEIIARNEYTKTEEKNPIDCSLYYLALRKKNVLQGLWRMATWNREQAVTQRLLANNFEEPRWKTAALKNAYALLGKRRFEYSAAFFLLADHLREAANVCINQIGDIQLAITITRAYEGDDGPILKEILEGKVLVEAASEGNRWMASWAFWMLNRRSSAVRSLISPVDTLIPPTPASPGSPGMISLQARSYLSNDPALVVLYKHLREKTLQTLKGATQIPPAAEWAFVLRNARLYDRMGCDLLALDLVARWEFLRAPLPQTLTPFADTETDYRKFLRRRSSLVIADLPLRLPREAAQEAIKSPTTPKRPQPKPKPTMFEEPDSNSLLDSFGF